MIAWESAKQIQEQVAGVPDNWLHRFAAARPNDIRKLGEHSNSTLLFRSSAVLEAVESGELKRKRNLAKAGEEAA